MLKVRITYPTKDEEVQIIDSALIGEEPKVDKVITPQDIMDTRSLINQIYIDEKLKQLYRVFGQMPHVDRRNSVSMKSKD